MERILDKEYKQDAFGSIPHILSILSLDVSVVRSFPAYIHLPFSSEIQLIT